MISSSLEESIELRPYLQRVEERLQEVVGEHSQVIKPLISPLFAAGGKRLRPQLVLLTGWRKNGDWNSVIDVAVAAELLHSASLIHDDIIDDGDLRRGQPTINQLRGNQAAVMAGDFLFARALMLLSQESTSQALPLLVHSIEAMCEGVIRELDLLFDPKTSVADYLTRIDDKTASLLAACSAAGAVVRGAPPEEVVAYQAYGRNLGISFQIVDDLLDFTSDPKTLGKPAESDFAQGILTLPVIYLLQDPHWSGEIKEILKRRNCTENELSTVKKAVAETNSLERSYALAKEHQEKAMEFLRHIPRTPTHQILEQLTEMALNRDR